MLTKDEILSKYDLFVGSQVCLEISKRKINQRCDIKRKNIENIFNIENIKHYFRQPILARLSQDMMNFK